MKKIIVLLYYLMEFFHSYQLGNVSSFEDIVMKLKQINKYDKFFNVAYVGGGKIKGVEVTKPIKLAS